MNEEKTNRIAKKLEMAANVAIVVAVIVIGVVFVRSRYQNQRPHTISAGAKFALKDVDWRANGKSLVLAVSTTCHFCTESAGFYRVLADQCRQQHVRTIAVLPQTVDEGRSYLQNEGVTVDEVRQATFSGIEISGTPTLLLVDQDGIVRSVWLGKLPSEEEKEVIGKISPPS